MAAKCQIPIRRVGSYGYAFADPLVEVKTAGAPTILYGLVDEEAAAAIVYQHVGQGKLLDGHIIGSRQRGKTIDGPVTAILVRDSSRDEGDKTEFFKESIHAELTEHGLADTVQVVSALDLGIYDEGLTVQLLPSGVTYTNVLSRDITRLVTESVQKQEVLDHLLYSSPDLQERIVLRNCGIIDPESLDDALRHDSYKGFVRALTEQSPEQVIDTVKTSGLRGRGGAGFPTGVKWELTRKPEADRKFVICNADEGDPGAFMDRSVLEGDPHAVLEGLMLAAFAIGACKGYFYIRAEYPLAVKRIQKAIDQTRERGLLGENILGSGWSFDAAIRLGAGAFVCGEETALIASIEGRRGSPEPRPPYPSVQGLWGKPTSINNVETLAAVPWIVAKGGEAYARFGTEKSKGTKVFAVTGKVLNAQLVEVPMGTSVRDIIFGICGGAQDAVPIKGVQTGGPSGGIIPEPYLDTPITYENLSELGSIMGSGGMLVMNENDCMVDVAAFYLKFCVDESCGKCAPCRAGGYQMLQLLQKIAKGRGEPGDLDLIRRICKAMQCASLCGLGQTAPNPVLSSLRFFEDEFLAYIEGGTSYARKLKKARAEGRNLKDVV
ncbi:MAG: NADH-quinone oxidoreductase subunit F [Akkermansiaceae bacterium]|nr:NADH-quinone oxidoreductase subunit F [Akkermansiaceae bacterium]